MAFWVLDQWPNGELDYPTLGFRAAVGDVLDAAAAPDGRWSSTPSGPETVTRYTLGGDPSYVEPGDGHVLTWSDPDNAYVPTARSVFVDEMTSEGLDAVLPAKITNPADPVGAVLDGKLAPIRSSVTAERNRAMAAEQLIREQIAANPPNDFIWLSRHVEAALANAQSVYPSTYPSTY